jgi:magnesium transporter
MVATALAVNLAKISLPHNEVMKRLAGWGAILALPTMIGGIYGMNFDHMPELHWTFGYPLVLGVMVGACGLVYRKLKRADWL